MPPRGSSKSAISTVRCIGLAPSLRRIGQAGTRDLHFDPKVIDEDWR